MNETVFRKKAIERVMGAESLNEYIRATKPGAWFALTGLFLILFGVLFKVFTGTISTTIRADGFLWAEGGNEAVRTYLPLSHIKKMKLGMEVQISPDYAPREEFGYLLGTVSHIGQEAVDPETLAGFFENYGEIAGKQKGPYYRVDFSLEKTEAGLRWSHQKGAEITLENGAYCRALIVIQKRHPYQYFWN